MRFNVYSPAHSTLQGCNPVHFERGVQYPILAKQTKSISLLFNILFNVKIRKEEIEMLGYLADSFCSLLFFYW